MTTGNKMCLIVGLKTPETEQRLAEVLVLRPIRIFRCIYDRGMFELYGTISVLRQKPHFHLTTNEKQLIVIAIK